tara:strand:+ start:1126 stop:2562 length:1437 start_codon:yes stop_codon:yes gene_type:complete
MKDKVYEMLQEYAEGGLVSKNAMSDYFLASAGKMTEVEFVGKHKISTLEFEKKFAEDNNVDISGTEKLSEVTTTPKGVKMDYSKKPKTMAEGGPVEIDPVSGNEIPPGATAENVRDDVPAMLSEGEYVVPADVLKYFGVNFFEELRAKAKEGMMSMEMDGRTGGEPMSAPAPQMPPEGMAEGGVVGGFDPTAWRTPGLGNIGGAPTNALMGSSAYTYKEYFGPGGVSQTILLINGEPAQAIPEGYSETAPTAAVAPTTGGRSNRRSDINRAAGVARNPTTGTSGPGLGGILGNPLDDLDFSDTASIDTWAADRLAESTLQRGVGMMGLVGSAGSAAKELRDIAAVSAAARYYADMGDQESSDRLMGMADAARADQGLIGRFSERFSDGEDIYESFKERQGVSPTSAPKSAASNLQFEAVKSGSGTKTKKDPKPRTDDGRDTDFSKPRANPKDNMAKTGTKPTNKFGRGGLVTKRTTKK